MPSCAACSSVPNSHLAAQPGGICGKKGNGIPEGASGSPPLRSPCSLARWQPPTHLPGGVSSAQTPDRAARGCQKPTRGTCRGGAGRASPPEAELNHITAHHLCSVPPGPGSQRCPRPVPPAWFAREAFHARCPLPKLLSASHETTQLQQGAGAGSSRAPFPRVCAQGRDGAGSSPPPTRPQSFERDRGRVLTFSTSSLQSCGGHRATGKEISVGDVEKHRALTPTRKDAPRAGSGDELALHPAAAARLVPLGLGPAALSSVSQRVSEAGPPQPAAQLRSLPGLLW